MPGPSGQWPQEVFVDPLTGEPIPSPFGPGTQPGGVADPLGASTRPTGPAPSPLTATPAPPEPMPTDPVAADGATSPEAEAVTTNPGTEPVPGADGPATGPIVWPDFEHQTYRPDSVRRKVIRWSVIVGALLLVTVMVVVVGQQSASRPGRTALPTDPAYPSFTLPPLTLPPTPSRVPVPPVVPGWQGVSVPKYNVAYDVPPDWKVESTTTLVGYDDPTGKPMVVMSGVSTYKDGFCPDHRFSYRAHLGFSRTDLSDQAQAARNAVRSWADAGYSGQIAGGSALVTMGAPTKVPVDGGKNTAMQVTGLVAVQHPRECDAPNVMLNAVAVTLPDGSVTVCVTEADQDVPDALSPADLSRIIDTIRPLHR